LTLLVATNSFLWYSP